MSRKLPPDLERAVKSGLMTREHAEKVDAWAEDLAKRQVRGEVTEDEVNVIVRTTATVDAFLALAAEKAKSRS